MRIKRQVLYCRESSAVSQQEHACLIEHRSRSCPRRKLSSQLSIRRVAVQPAVHPPGPIHPWALGARLQRDLSIAWEFFDRTKSVTH